MICVFVSSTEPLAVLKIAPIPPSGDARTPPGSPVWRSNPEISGRAAVASAAAARQRGHGGQRNHLSIRTVQSSVVDQAAVFIALICLRSESARYAEAVATSSNAAREASSAVDRVASFFVSRGVGVSRSMFERRLPVVFPLSTPRLRNVGFGVSNQIC